MASLINKIGEWPYPEASGPRGDDWPRAQDLTGNWYEIDQDTHDEFLNCLPPIYVPNGFMLSEAQSHDDQGIPTRAYHVELKGRFFMAVIPQNKRRENYSILLALLADQADPKVKRNPKWEDRIIMKIIPTTLIAISPSA